MEQSGIWSINLVISILIMIDKKINRFCELVAEINEINKELDEEKSNYYNGGYSFEECNKYKIDQLCELQSELKEIIKYIQLT